MGEGCGAEEKELLRGVEEPAWEARGGAESGNRARVEGVVFSYSLLSL